MPKNIAVGSLFTVLWCVFYSNNASRLNSKKWIETHSPSHLLFCAIYEVVALLNSFSSHIDLARKLVHKDRQTVAWNFQSPFFYSLLLYSMFVPLQEWYVYMVARERDVWPKWKATLSTHTQRVCTKLKTYEIHTIHKCIIYTNVRLAFLGFSFSTLIVSVE